MTTFRKSICLLLLISVAASPAMADSAAETSVKAAIVHKISKFVAWPDSAFESDDSPMRFCVVGDDQILNALQELSNRKIHGREVLALSASDPESAVSLCDVLYLGDDDVRAAEEWLSMIGNRPILTFGETGKYGADVSIVSVMVRRNKVRFEINLDANRNTGLSIGAQLLQLAASVGGRG